MNRLPTISIVVPNFNGGKTLRGTLQGLVDQQYPKLEILVADGGSTDDSVEIIQSFAAAACVVGKRKRSWAESRDQQGV